MEIIQLNSISETHRLMGLEKPKHPLISVYHHTTSIIANTTNISVTGGLYYIAMKDGISGSFRYGRNSYDFEEGAMMFLALNQVYTTPEQIEVENEGLGWSIIFHPDLIRQSSLGNTIHEFTFFDYDVNEALHLSDKEKQTMNELVGKIEEEINQNIDKHSQEIININLETLLKYCKRYYDRQFYTRTNLNKRLWTESAIVFFSTESHSSIKLEPSSFGFR